MPPPNPTFGFCIVYVESVAETLAFYESAFGLQRRFLHEGGDYGELETGQTALAFASHALGANHFPEGYVRLDRSSRPVGTELAFVVEDVGAAWARALGAGATPIAAPARMPWGQIVAWVRTPEGSVVELCTAVDTTG